MNAREAVAQAADIAAGLKPGSWDSAQAMALISIAQSLATIAENGTD